LLNEPQPTAVALASAPARPDLRGALAAPRDRGGNRQLNAALYRIAITQARYYAPARTYLERKRGEGKSRREAIRCLKRQLARPVSTTLETSPTLT
jgi:hypothetical protein